jgi:hypothetical protein
MDPIERHERKRQAWQRLRAQKRRAEQEAAEAKPEPAPVTAARVALAPGRHRRGRWCARRVWRSTAGAIAKGLLADLLAARLAEHPAYAVDCCGGSAGLERRLLVDDPFGGEPIHELRLREGRLIAS